MASKLALSLVIGGAVASSVGAAFRTVESGIDKLKKKGDKAKVLQSTIGETMKLQAEWKRAHETGAASADKLLRKLNGNLDALRKQGLEVGRLGREYQRLGRDARAADLQVKGREQIAAGRASLKSTVGAAAVGIGLTAVPTKISADYQAIIRDIAIKADAANQPEEVQLSRNVIQTSNDTGMARNDVADLINQLVGAGMELDKAMAYSKTAAKFAVGQGASGVDTASMIMALQQNAKITDPKVMQQALEAIAYQGQAGSFEANDMAKWFPQLLAGMEKNGITGLDAVSSLGSMLQVQMKTAGSSDEAANNFKNWMEKIGAGDVVKAYKDAGIDYQASLNTGLQKGMNVIEASMGLAMQYVEATDPAKAKKIKDAQAKIDKQVDPEKAKAALEALEKTLRTGDLFADMQVKAALTAYGQNRGLYNELKADSMKATGILDKNLAERRETSALRWSELVQSTDDAMRSIGDAIRPATDAFATGATVVARWVTKLSDDVPQLAMGLAGLATAVGTVFAARSAARVGRGVFNVARGRAWGYRRAGKLPGGPEQATAPKTGRRVVDAGLGALGKVLGVPASNDPAQTPGNEPMRVFVVNADAFGGLSPSGPNSGPGGATRGRRVRRRRRAVASAPVRSPLGVHRPVPAAVKSPVRLTPVVAPPAAIKPPATAPTMPAPWPPVAMPSPVAPKVAAPPVPVAQRLAPALPAAGVSKLVAAPAVPELSRLGQIVRSVRGVTKVAGKLPGGQVADAIPGVLDTALNARTRDEKAEGYGGVAGGMAGAWAGGIAGAAIGSVVPVIGTAVGGAIGMALGGLGGESLGGWLGKTWFGDDKDKPQQEQEPVNGLAAPVPQAPAVATPVMAMPAPVVEAPKPLPPVLSPPVVVTSAPAAKAPDPVPAAPAPVASPPAPVKLAPEPVARPPAPVVQGMAPPAAPVSVQPPAVTVTVPGAKASAPTPAVKIEARAAPAPALAPAPAVPNKPKVLERLRPEPARGLRRNAAERAESMGDVVRSLVEVAAPVAAAPAPPPPKPAEQVKSEPPKVEQTFSIALSMPVTIEGDVKDPYQTVAAMETPLRGLFERLQREFAGNRFSAQLYDEAHV
ncbi:phage tail tape measure protein [Pseudomonas sp. N2-11]|uniref:phage tail tape measure protein n=1 Tax=Pseudomonas sp. N2-11 TaxID=2962038 RepID=UPI0020B7F65F|nr:phage tail tape measure protein [Pseudomonas sp. N2-11]MCP3792096.1 phage tail tape measure protein [Pseudomonas sp. N2-11]